ncbi:hypothetical protein [Risungbinella massiliensis]|uniref:hypothetical protein n=1 Tax=Risungbinella massiliensis TaxID=1329796 RepID=UPI0005CB9E04|nr:hypothetical protein [Risungbinella massiliensis]
MRELPKCRLYELYVEEFYTYQDLARYFKCSTETIRLNIERHSIPKRARGQSLLTKCKLSERDLTQLLPKLYWEDKLSIFQIAEEFK